LAQHWLNVVKQDWLNVVLVIGTTLAGLAQTALGQRIPNEQPTIRQPISTLAQRIANQFQQHYTS